ncbi:MAG: hypothetical protein ACHP7O_02380 [Burkholderiales bacterium]
MESAFAGSFSFSRGHEGRREELRAARHPDAAQQSERTLPGAPNAIYPTSSTFSANPAYPSLPGVFGESRGGIIVNRFQQPVRRMGGRMSMEERRALRRQINEAGRDIYAPRH